MLSTYDSVRRSIPRGQNVGRRKYSNVHVARVAVGDLKTAVAPRETYSYVITFQPTYRFYGTEIFKLIISSYGKFEFLKNN
ncbi:MAG: hypothetical protein LBC68_05005 [Prevotellaceae bacterium]|nr:hypothetical protein [Prevotellaceae bacterium]